MFRNVGVLLTLLAVHDLRTSAAGNIGCLFSETLCEEDREWCFDDHAFGHCLSDYGHYKEEDLHRYDLGSEELRQLEQEMQRLFLLGYRWSHVYTQCVLQTLLHSIRLKSEFDISSCNGGLDQDLEGALRAIEGEELEQVDPRNLAIVRFTPSVTDPHSDYADEVYFPPIKDQLLEDHPGNQPDQDHEHQDSVTSGQGGEGERKGGRTGGRMGSGGDKTLSRPPQLAPLPANPPGPPPSDGNAPPSAPDNLHPIPDNSRALNYINYFGNINGYDDDDGDEDEEDDEDVYQSPYHYQTPVNPVFRKRGMPSRGNSASRQLSFNDWKQVSDFLEDMSRLQQPSRFSTDEAVFFPEGYLDEEEDEDEGVFDERPTRPMYTEGGRQFMPGVDDEKGFMDPRESSSWSNMPQNLRGVPGGFRNSPDDLRNMQGMYDNLQRSPVDFRNLRGDMRNVPNDLRNFPGFLGQYVPQEVYMPDNIVPENTHDRLLMQDEPPLEANFRDMTRDRLLLEDNFPNQFPRTSPKLSALQEAFGPQLSNLRDYDDFQEYSENGFLDDYDDYDMYVDGRLRSGQSSTPKFVKKDEESANVDYDLLSNMGYNFQRPMRVDVKKPGPNFNSNNNFAFEYTDEDDRADEMVDDDVATVDGFGLGRAGDGMLFARLVQEMRAAPFRGSRSDEVNNENDEEVEESMIPIGTMFDKSVPDLLLADNRLVDESDDDIIPVFDLEKNDKRIQETKDEGEETKVGTESSSSPSSSSSSSSPPATDDPADTTTTITTTTLKPLPPATSYVHITVNEGFRDKEQATSLAREAVLMTGLNTDYMDRLNVETNKVVFHIKENEQGITAEDVAKKAQEMRDYFKTKLGVEINQTSIGSKTTTSAVVFTSSEKHILAAAAIVCGVMAALLVAATVLFFLRRHAKAKAKLLGLSTHDTEASKDYQELCRGIMAGKAGEGGKSEPPSTQAPSQRMPSLSRDLDNGNNSPSSRSSTSSCEEPVASNMDISTGHMVLSYMEDHLKNKDRLEQEWIALCAYEAEPCATTLALKPENNQKNRYPDAVPYDHNRVVLNAHANLNGSDYINASSITDHDPRNPAYIATQGPLESTAADFWQLVWEQGSVVIVMLTRLTENGHAFCHRYWPEEGSDLYHIYEVHLVSEHIWCDDYLVRSFYLKNVRTGETRTVTQFHFLSWPDSGTPASTKALLEFRRKVNKSYRGRSCPIIVHCSDGIGRTGTYCLIDMVLNRMAKGAKEIDIAATLEHIRDQRPHMVKSKAQFEFVLMAVAEEVHAILKALPQ